MADRTQTRPRAEAGFTLAEMLVALGILCVGVTTLLAALGDSMALRRGSDARLQAQQAVEDLVHRVANAGLELRVDAQTPFDVQLAAQAPTPLEGAPGLTIASKLEFDDARPDVAMLRIQVSWLDGGETVSEEFLRVIPRQLPLGARVQAFRKEHDRAR